MLKIFKKLVKSKNERTLKEYQKIVNKINLLESDFEQLTDKELKKIILEYKESKNITVEKTFAYCREVSKRVLGMRHYDTQIIGGLALLYGNIAEMKTGEGKTIVSALPAVHKALLGVKVHIITTNDYLAERDKNILTPLYDFFDISISFNSSKVQFLMKNDIYKADVIYGTNSEFCFDYLRNNLVYSKEHQIFSNLENSYAIVDEVDSILIDSAKTPLIISGESDSKFEDYYWARDLAAKMIKSKFISEKVKSNFMVEMVKNNVTIEDGYQEEDFPNVDYYFDGKTADVQLSELGYEKLENFLLSKNLIKDKNEVYINPKHVTYLKNALIALNAFFKNRDYIINENNEVIIIDQQTGRLLENNRWTNGLHQAVEAKENVEIKSENIENAKITYQSFFKLYHNLSGMTGTANTEAAELYSIYGLETVIIPTNKPIQRVDYEDILFFSEKDKYDYLEADILKYHKTGQPLLIGTTSVDVSEKVSNLLDKMGLKYNLLNAKNHEKESIIIEEAGRLNAITISTNMAGRGTDIILGGNINRKINEIKNNDNLSDIVKEVKIQEIKVEFENNRDAVIKAGGLMVIGVDKNESRRIDNQLRGRSGRQGDVGASQFYVSFDDNLLLKFKGESEKLKNILSKIVKFLPENQKYLTSSNVSSSIERFQKAIENHDANGRVSLLKYDEVLSEHRDKVYAFRNEILDYEKIRLKEVDSVFNLSLPLNCFEAVIFEKYQNQFIHDDENILLAKHSNEVEKELKEFYKSIVMLDKYIKNNYDFFENDIDNKFKEIKEYFFSLNDNKNLEHFSDLLFSYYEKKFKFDKIINDDYVIAFEKEVLLNSLDKNYSLYLSQMEEIRQLIHLRGYAQKNPLYEYQEESQKTLKQMLENFLIDSGEDMLNKNIDRYELIKPEIVTYNKLKSNYIYKNNILETIKYEVVVCFYNNLIANLIYNPIEDKLSNDEKLLLKENVKNNIDLLQRFKNKCTSIMQDEIKFINDNNYSNYYLYKKNNYLKDRKLKLLKLNIGYINSELHHINSIYGKNNNFDIYNMFLNKEIDLMNGNFINEKYVRYVSTLNIGNVVNKIDEINKILLQTILSVDEYNKLIFTIEKKESDKELELSEYVINEVKNDNENFDDSYEYNDDLDLDEDNILMVDKEYVGKTFNF